ncbi:MAG: PEP-CTERM sorting domain-containing protein [Pyrinomonadaceae bacterium]
MFRFPQPLTPVLLLLACLLFASAQEAHADAISINTSTVLLDATNFTPGTTYYAVFQLTGGGTDNNSALLANFNFGSGNAIARAPSDPTFGTFIITPDPNASGGIGQAGVTLTLDITPGDAFSLYAQQFIAGNEFSFMFSLTNNFLPGNSFDGFTFQLYDASFGALLFEQTFDLTGAPQAVPEPATMLLVGTGLAGLAGAMRQRRNKDSSRVG